MQRVLMGAVADDEPFLRIRVNAHIDEEDGPAPPGALPARRADRGPRQANNGDGANNNEDDADDGNDAADVAAAAENTIRVSGTSLGRLIGGALIIPRISSLMGSLLFWLSKRSMLLRKFLAVRPPLRLAGRVGPLGLTTGTGLGAVLGPGAVFRGNTLGEQGLLKKLGLAGMLGLSVAWRGSYAWAECDPVWCALSWLCLDRGRTDVDVLFGIGGETRWGLGCSRSYVVCFCYRCRRVVSVGADERAP